MKKLVDISAVAVAIGIAVPVAELIPPTTYPTCEFGVSRVYVCLFDWVIEAGRDIDGPRETCSFGNISITTIQVRAIAACSKQSIGS